MPVASPAAVRRQIKSGKPDPIYLLQGDDEIEKSALAAEFAGLVDEELRDFNVERIHAGGLTTAEKLADCAVSLAAAVRTFPMMSPRRVVIVLQAEWLLAPRRDSATATRVLDELEALFEQPEALTTLVLVVTAIDKRSRMYRVLAKRATLVECGAIEDQIDAERWVKTRVAAAGAAIDAAAARLIAARAGLDVKRLRTDVERLLLYTLGQGSITADDVRQLVGPAGLQDPWAMANAIEGGEAGEALRQLTLMLEAGDSPEKVLGQLGWLVRTKFPAVAPGKLSRAVEALFRADLDLKRSAGAPRVVLERLVVELCAGARTRAVAGR